MSDSLYKEEEIITALKSDSNQYSVPLNSFYQEGKEFFTIYVQKNKGSKSDAEDIFQDGIKHFVLNIRSGIFQHKSSIKTYLFRICRNLWLSKLRRNNKWQSIQQILTLEAKGNVYMLSPFQNEERKVLLNKALAFIPDACRQVLSLWSQGYSMKEIVQRTIYKNEMSVMKKKSICLKSLVTKVKNQPGLMRELLNHL